MEIFAERLRELRMDANMSRNDLAKLLRVNLRTISYWELNQRECNLEQLVSIAKVFKVSTDYLLGLEN